MEWNPIIKRCDFSHAISESKNMERNSNIELLRICCMLMIIGEHIIMKHETQFSLSNIDEFIKLFFWGSFSVAVNSFVLISGYFGIKFKTERLVHLVIQTFFYSATIFIIVLLLGWYTINSYRDFFFFFPILTKKYWFITCYIILYILAPWLNIWVKSLEKRSYRKLLIVGFLIIYVWPTFSFLFAAPQFVDDAGYGIINFVYLYMLGYYLRHHYMHRYNSFRYFLGYLTMAFLLFFSQVSISYFWGFEFTSWLSYNTIFVFWGAIFFFMSFSSMNFHSYFINRLAKPCLAVFLIHAHPLIWRFLCNWLGVPSYHGLSFIALFLISPIIIYAICSIIETGRVWLMQQIEKMFRSR